MMANFLKRLLGQSSAAPPVVQPEVKRVSFEQATADDDVVRMLQLDEAERLRHQFLTGHFHTAVNRCFENDLSLQSVTLAVGQYWCDEAIDAVQPELIWSQLETPDLAAAVTTMRNEDLIEGRDGAEGDTVNLGGRSHWDLFDYKLSPELEWASNHFCIPLFAAFCVEEGHQEGEFLEFESPVATYRRTGPKTSSMAFEGQMVRPWLDGVAFFHSDETMNVASFEKWIGTSMRR